MKKADIRLCLMLTICSGFISCFIYLYKESNLIILPAVIQGDDESITPSTYSDTFSATTAKLSLDSKRRANLSQKAKIPDDNSELRFQPVDDNNETYVYSAIYDNRNNPVIMVTAVLQDQLALDRYSCISHDSKTYLKARLEYITEPPWKYKYRGGFIICNLEKSEKPEYISIVLNSQIRNNTNFTQKNKLKVQYPSKFVRNFTRCVPPFHNFKNQISLIQMLESDLMFGMDHFITYNHSGLTGDIQRTLKSYQNDGVLTLLRWDLPVPRRDIHYFGQMSCMHDCILRNMFVSRYVFLADIDEIVVSDKYSSWESLTTGVFKKHSNCGAISIRNAFFPIHFNDGLGDFAGKSEAKKLGLTFLLKTTHTRLHSIGDRSKVLVRPETIHMMWIHGVAKYHDSTVKTCPVNNPKDALLHHYRLKRSPDMRLPYAEDKTFQKYSKELISRVNKRFQKIKSLN